MTVFPWLLRSFKMFKIFIPDSLSRFPVGSSANTNAGSWTNGMPMTSSLGCGVWGGNITNENVTMKHMMNYTWVSRPIAEDRPSEQELFGEFFGQEVA